jgi:hypothetical protein
MLYKLILICLTNIRTMPKFRRYEYHLYYDIVVRFGDITWLYIYDSVIACFCVTSRNLLISCFILTLRMKMEKYSSETSDAF